MVQFKSAEQALSREVQRASMRNAYGCLLILIALALLGWFLAR